MQRDELGRTDPQYAARRDAATQELFSSAGISCTNGSSRETGGGRWKTRLRRASRYTARFLRILIPLFGVESRLFSCSRSHWVSCLCLWSRLCWGFRNLAPEDYKPPLTPPRDWIATIPSWPETFKYRPMKETALELSKELRDPRGRYRVEVIIALTHCRVPNVSDRRRDISTCRRADRGVWVGFLGRGLGWGGRLGRKAGNKAGENGRGDDLREESSAASELVRRSWLVRRRLFVREGRSLEA